MCPHSSNTQSILASIQILHWFSKSSSSPGAAEPNKNKSTVLVINGGKVFDRLSVRPKKIVWCKKNAMPTIKMLGLSEFFLLQRHYNKLKLHVRGE